LSERRHIEAEKEAKLELLRKEQEEAERLMEEEIAKAEESNKDIT